MPFGVLVWCLTFLFGGVGVSSNFRRFGDAFGVLVVSSSFRVWCIFGGVFNFRVWCLFGVLVWCLQVLSCLMPFCWCVFKFSSCLLEVFVCLQVSSHWVPFGVSVLVCLQVFVVFGAF